ncbi:MAG: repressor LexA [Ignavibacteriae bacterium]|nr:repressor LexA [Ignavibacteriota bacterium]
MKKELTDRQKEILDFIFEFQHERGYPPTYREIGKRFEINSTFGVKRHIDALVKKGYITTNENSNRSISITDNSSNVFPIAANENDSFVEIPIVGRVAAGYPILAEENIENRILVDSNFTKTTSSCFGLKVKGDSMIEAGILDGDLVIVNQQKVANNGDIVVAMLGDESTLKTFLKEDNKIYLKPENQNYRLIDVNNFEDFSIIGKVISVIRYYN